jgi:hypothetical protein
LLLFQVMQAALQVVVGRGFALQVSVDLANLLADDVCNIPQRLFDGIFGHVPLKTSDVAGQITYKRTKVSQVLGATGALSHTVVGQQVFVQLVSLVLEDFPQI